MATQPSELHFYSKLALPQVPDQIINALNEGLKASLDVPAYKCGAKKPEDIDYFTDKQRDQLNELLALDNPLKNWYKQKNAFRLAKERADLSEDHKKVVAALERDTMQKSLIKYELNFIHELEDIFYERPTQAEYDDMPALRDDDNWMALYGNASNAFTYVKKNRWQRFIKPYLQAFIDVNNEESKHYGWNDLTKRIAETNRKMNVGVIPNTPGYNAHYNTAMDATRQCHGAFALYVMCARAMGQDEPRCQAPKFIYNAICERELVEEWDDKVADGGFPTPAGMPLAQPFEYYRPGEEWVPHYD